MPPNQSQQKKNDTQKKGQRIITEKRNIKTENTFHFLLQEEEELSQIDKIDKEETKLIQGKEEGK